MEAKAATESKCINMNILVTGATGFVGRSLCQALAKHGHHVSVVTRNANATFLIDCAIICKDLDGHTDFEDSLKSIEVVIHLAGRAHVLNDQSNNPYQAYADINIGATKNLARQAANSGVKRFIFLSSIKVNGETTASTPFNEESIPNPEDDYGKTKFEAEKALAQIAENSNMEVVVIRPPLIYGKGVKANFKNLIKLCQLKLPLPFGAIHNKRSMIYIDNLIDFIMVCTTHPNTANQIFLVSDDEDVSTTELVHAIRKTLEVPSLLIPIPQSWTVFLLKLAGKASLATRLCGNLQVDISKAKRLLGWKPPFTFKQGIKKTIQEN